jgi:hypothetical protein
VLIWLSQVGQALKEIQQSCARTSVTKKEQVDGGGGGESSSWGLINTGLLPSFLPAVVFTAEISSSLRASAKVSDAMAEKAARDVIKKSRRENAANEQKQFHLSAGVIICSEFFCSFVG